MKNYYIILTFLGHEEKTYGKERDKRKAET